MNKILIILTILISLFLKQNSYSQTPLTEAVDFTVTDLDGNTIQLFNLLDNEGKYVLIDFFFTTCVPCQDAVPKISEAYAHFGCGEYDVEFIAMDYENTNEQCQVFDETFGVAYPTVSGIEGGGTQVCLDYEIPIYPTVILIAPDHSIVEQYIWPIPTAETVISTLENYGISNNECSLIADFSSDNTEICNHEYIVFSNQSQGNINTFEWTFEGGYPPVSNDANPVIIYPSSGIFDVSLKVINGNEESYILKENMIKVHNCTGINKGINQVFSISPNPSNGVFNICLPNEGLYNIWIYSSNNQLVYTTESTQNNLIDLSTLNRGVYILKAQHEDKIYIEKVIIN